MLRQNLGPRRPAKTPTVDRLRDEKGYQGKRDNSELERYVFDLFFGEFGIDLSPGDNLYLCPWHDDTNGSLGIDAERCGWYCFGCGEGGGLRELVDRVGIIPQPLEEVGGMGRFRQMAIWAMNPTRTTGKPAIC